MSLKHAKRHFEDNKSVIPSDTPAYVLNRALVQMNDGLIDEFAKLHAEIAELKAALAGRK